MLDKKKKQTIIKKFKTHDDDTGSPQVQIAILTEEIKELTEHLKNHKKDFSSRRGLFRKVNLRRRLLNFLQKTEEENYNELIKKLKLKKKNIMPELEQNTPRDEEDYLTSDNEKENNAADDENMDEETKKEKEE